MGKVQCYPLRTGFFYVVAIRFGLKANATQQIYVGNSQISARLKSLSETVMECCLVKIVAFSYFLFITREASVCFSISFNRVQFRIIFSCNKPHDKLDSRYLFSECVGCV